MNVSRDDEGYEGKQIQYFELVRREILPLLPEKFDTVFEAGCGTGNTLSFLKSSGRCRWAGGIELFHEAAEVARKNIDLVLEGSIETVDLPLEEQSMDVILCLDVLEHLVDPWKVVHRLHALLKPGGVMICSIPNIRYFRTLLPLVLRGKWEYTDSGILDKTHLRFFTRKSAIELATCSGLIVDRIATTGLEKERGDRRWYVLTLGLLRPFFVWQYLIRAVRKN
jgi:2-polyprenyl-3-methyl-5-hydroxy-6-metoxy-1,4-benzoquinol methylase